MKNPFNFIWIRIIEIVVYIAGAVAFFVEKIKEFFGKKEKVDEIDEFHKKIAEIMAGEYAEDEDKEKKKNWKLYAWIISGVSFLIVFLQVLTEVNWEVWACEGLVLVNTILIALMIYGLAKAKKFWGIVPEGEIMFVVTGETLHKTIVNIKDYYLEKELVDIPSEKGKIIKTTVKTWKIVLGKDKDKSWFNKNLGIFWGGFWPFFTFHEYWFAWQKTVFSEEGLIIEHRRELVPSLFFRYTYPVVARGVELRGNIKIDIGAELIIEIVYPYIPVFFLKGNWFAPLISAVEGAIADFGRGKDINEFRELEKAKESSKGDNFSNSIKKINSKLEKSIGVRIKEIYYSGYKLSGVTKEVDEATTAKEVARLKAEARREEAKGEKAYHVGVGIGKARALRAIFSQAQKYPYGMQTLQEQIRTEATVGFTGDVLVNSAPGQQPVIPVIPLTKKDGEKKKEGGRKND